MCKLLSLAWILFVGQLADFSANTSLPCVRYLNHGSRKWQRFLWFVVWFGAAGLTFNIVLDLSERFISNPLITVFESRPQGKPLIFPSVFICPQNIMHETRLQEYVNNSTLSMNSSTLKKCIQNYLQLMLIYNLSDADCLEFSNAMNNVTLKELNELTGVLKKPEDLIRKCHFAGMSVSSSLCFKPFITEHGYCFHFNNILLRGKRAGNKPLDDPQMHFIEAMQEHWGLRFNINQTTDENLKIFILDTAEMPTLKMTPHYIWHNRSPSFLKFAVRERLTGPGVQSLSLHQRNCLFDHEWPLDELLIAQYTLQPFYQESVCFYFCHAVEIIKLCDCLPFYYSALFIRLNVPYCNLTQLNCLNSNLENVRLHKCVNCYKTCESNDYYITQVVKPFWILNEGGIPFEVGLSIWPMLTQRTNVIFGWIELLLSFGGVFSLFLGISAMNVIELFYFLTLNLILKFIRNKNALLTMARRKLEYMPRLNMSLRPNFGQ